MIKKKKVAVWSNASISRTGFGTHAKILLKNLQDRGYEVIELAAGVSETASSLAHLPWKGYGLTPDDQELKQRVIQAGAEPMLGYGRMLVEQIIKKEKPDAIIAIEDSWAFQGFEERPIYRLLPDNWIFWSPVDSTPILQEQIDFFGKVKNKAVKATFAQRELAAHGIKAEFWPALMESAMTPDHAAGLALREKSGIAADTILSGFVFRNQLRKLILPQFRALAMFKESFPNKKIKLVFHTNPFEKDQWNCVRHAKLEGLEPEDVYYTRICPACKDFSLGPALVEKTLCKCGRGNLHHPDANHGLSEKDLNTVYNSMDCYVHTANSGGFEMPLMEAVLAGLPCACPCYSYGEMFVESGFVWPLKYHDYDEVRSGYKKAASDPYAIFEFWEFFKAYEQDCKQEKQIAWGREFCNVDKICSQVCEFIEAAPTPNYNWDFPCENPSMPAAEDNLDWAKELVLNFFGEPQTPDTYETIVKGLQEGRSRESFYQQSQDIVREQKVKFDPKALFRDDGRRRLLVCLDKNAIAALPVLEELKKKYADWSIYLLTNSANRGIVEHIEGLTTIWSDKLPPNLALGDLVDLVLNPFN